jgi:chromosome segregation ATPase
MPEEKQNPVAPGNEGQNPAPASPAQPLVTPKFEVKDGAYIVDGKKYVKESDLIAAKESLTKQLETAQSTHNAAVDKLKLDVSAAQTEVAQANAALEEAKKARTTGDISVEELSRVKKEAEEAKTSLASLQTSSLDYRRKYIMAVYNIPVNSEAAKNLQNKDAKQLDSFEEALKALHAGRGGAGNYAVGGGGGGAAPVSDMDRAKSLIAATPIRGSRNEPPNRDNSK